MSSAKLLLLAAAAACCLVVWPPPAKALSLQVRDGRRPGRGPPCSGGPGSRPGPGGPPGCWTASPPPQSSTAPPPAQTIVQTTAQLTTEPAIPPTIAVSEVSSSAPAAVSSTIVPPSSSPDPPPVSSDTASQPAGPSTTATTAASTPLPTLPLISTSAMSDSSPSIGSSRTLVITLSTVLSAVGVLLIVGGVLICCHYRRKRVPFFKRGVTPIDDDEIETWKVSRPSEKYGRRPEVGEASAWGAAAAAANHARQQSSSSTRKPPSVIVYHNAIAQPPRMSDDFSPRSLSSTAPLYPRYARLSVDKELPRTPAQARAPNARAGLTDDAVPGDPSFIPAPRRHPSRLSKMPSSMPRPAHSTRRSSRSSVSARSFIYPGSEAELHLSPRASSDYAHHYSRNHSRVYSSSSIPPRLSFSDDGIIGGLSPRPLFREDIGRAIG